MNTIDRYICRSFIGGCIPVLLLLLSLFSFLGLSEELEDVGKGAYDLPDALLVIAYTLPARLVYLLPVTVLLGGLLGLGALANNSELTAMRAAAISPMRMAVPIIALSFALIALVGVIQSMVIPGVEHSAAQLRAKTLIDPALAGIDTELGVRIDREFWTRNQDLFIRIGRVLPDRRLSGVEIYAFDEKANLTRMLQAQMAELLSENTWLLYEVYETLLSETRSETRIRETLVWHTLLSEAETHTLITPASALAPGDLWRSIGRLEANNMNSEPHRVIFWTQMSVPVGLLGMALLTLPFLLNSTRSVPVGRRVALGGLIGIIYYLVQQISGYLAGILHWNVVLTVLSPGLLILGIAVILLVRASSAPAAH